MSLFTPLSEIHISLILISLESKHSDDIKEVLTVGTRHGLFGIKCIKEPKGPIIVFLP